MIRVDGNEWQPPEGMSNGNRSMIAQNLWWVKIRLSGDDFQAQTMERIVYAESGDDAYAVTERYFENLRNDSSSVIGNGADYKITEYEKVCIVLHSAQRD